MKITKADYNLVLALQKDGSLKYSELADHLGITAKTAAKRVIKEERPLGAPETFLQKTSQFTVCRAGY